MVGGTMPAALTPPGNQIPTWPHPDLAQTRTCPTLPQAIGTRVSGAWSPPEVHGLTTRTLCPGNSKSGTARMKWMGWQ